MLKLLALAGAILCALTINAEARQRHKTYLAHPDCNITMPCAGVEPSARGERIARQVGFGTAQKVYTPRAAASQPHRRVAGVIVNHPSGCPGRAFCGCGAAVRVFGAPVRSLWLELVPLPAIGAGGRHGRRSASPCLCPRGASVRRYLAGL